ncbi:Protein of unknown function, partial [Gryllus bimaculatus]
IQKHNKSFIRGCGCCSCTCQQEREQQSGPFRVSALQLRLHATEKGEPGKKSTKPPILILSLGPKQVSCTIAFPKTAWNASRTGLTFTSLSEATTISTSPPESTNHITIETIRESRLLEVTPPATPRTQPNNPALPSPPACSPASTATSGVAGLPPAPAKEGGGPPLLAGITGLTEKIGLGRAEGGGTFVSKLPVGTNPVADGTKETDDEDKLLNESGRRKINKNTSYSTTNIQATRSNQHLYRSFSKNFIERIALL